MGATYNQNVKKQSMAIEALKKVKEFVTRRLKNSQVKGQGHCNKAIEGFSNPRVKETEARQLKR